jgi:hypothetical protein
MTEAPIPSTPPPRATSDPGRWYETRIAHAEAEVSELESRMSRLATVRLVSFLGAVVPLLALETSPRGWWPPLLGLAAAMAVGFVVLVVLHRRTRKARDRARVREDLGREGLARLDRNWDALPLLRLEPPPSADHPWAGDLDVLGRASLGHLLGTPRTAPGRERLRTLLLHPHEGEVDGESGAAARTMRRSAMDHLSRHPDLLEGVQVAARSAERAGSAAELADFRAWAVGAPWTSPAIRDRWLLGARVLAGANVALLAAWFAGWPPFWLLGAALSLGIWARIRAEAHRRFEAVEGAEASLGRWAELLDVAASLPPGTPLLDRLREGASSPVDGARALAELRRISDWAQVRRSSLVYFPLAVLLAWDVHPLVPMERWRDQYGSRVDRWLEAVGELEVLVALALLRFDHPDWTLPDERPLPPRGPHPPGDAHGIEASELRHPLLPPTSAVGNDVVLPGPGRLLLVTGSNMSGKSTLLRALGVNQLLLLAGGPVAASAYRASPFVPWSSMRIRDSLAEGVSFFMAELHRLRRVVDAAREGPVLVLLDEILQGTNTAERRTAARIILGHLLEAGAVGAVSTHDLTLADAPELATRLEQVHLREEVGDVNARRTLSFDHRLRPGPATSRNALLLLELVGLGGELPEEGG